MSGAKKSCCGVMLLSGSATETGSTVSSTGVTVRSASTAASGDWRSGNWQLTAVTGSQSSASRFMPPSCIGQCTEAWFIGWDCAMTHGAAPATSHSDANVASRVRAIGFSLRRNQCIMVYSLAFERNAVYVFMTGHADKLSPNATGMTLISINVGLPREIIHGGRAVSTGIFKAPVAGPVRLGRLNLKGDSQADLRVHGGADKAVYVYPFEHYAFWERERRHIFKNSLSLEGEGERSSKREGFPYGQFGENFTTSGLLEDEVCIGDVFQIGAVRVQVTQPRSPCFKLGIRMDDENFPARFAAANRTGFYLRVLEEGSVAAGDAIAHVEPAIDSMSVYDVFRLRHIGGTRAEYERAARLPGLSSSWRDAFEKRLAEK